MTVHFLQTCRDQELDMFPYLNGTRSNEIKDSGSSNTQHVIVRGSLEAKLPPALNIKSANLRMGDIIGQGTILMCIVVTKCHWLYRLIIGEFGIVYKGYLAGQYNNECVAIKTLKGKMLSIIII